MPTTDKPTTGDAVVVQLKLKPKGIHCPIPACLSTRLRVLSVRRPCPGKKVRYLACTACGAKLKTVESWAK